jgi:hypothetical protein
MKLRVYIDASVVGGYFDNEFEDVTKLFFDRIFKRIFWFIFQKSVRAELSLAPDFVKDLRSKIPNDSYRYLELDDESRELAETYIREKILGKPSIDDACR